MPQNEQVPPFKEPWGEAGLLGDEHPTTGGGWLLGGIPAAGKSSR